MPWSLEGFRYPKGQACFCRCLVKKQDEKDEGTQDLRLVFGGASGMGIKTGEIAQKGIQVKVKKFLAFFVKKAKEVFRMVA